MCSSVFSLVRFILLLCFFIFIYLFFLLSFIYFFLLSIILSFSHFYFSVLSPLCSCRPPAVLVPEAATLVSALDGSYACPQLHSCFIYHTIRSPEHRRGGARKPREHAQARAANCCTLGDQ